MEFSFYLDYVKKLKYNEKPDYDKLVRVFKKLYVKQGYYDEDIKRLAPHNTEQKNNDSDDSMEHDEGDIYNFDIDDIIVPDWKVSK